MCGSRLSFQTTLGGHCKLDHSICIRMCQCVDPCSSQATSSDNGVIEVYPGVCLRSSLTVARCTNNTTGRFLTHLDAVPLLPLQGYLPRDYYALDCGYGTEAELRDLICLFHEHDIKVGHLH